MTFETVYYPTSVSPNRVAALLSRPPFFSADCLYTSTNMSSSSEKKRSSGHMGPRGVSAHLSLCHPARGFNLASSLLVSHPVGLKSALVKK